MNFFQRQQDVRKSSRRLVVLFVAGMVTVIEHDGVMTVAEIEPLRTVCALLHCPFPPLADARPEQVAP